MEPAGGRVGRHGTTARTALARPRPFRWWLRTGALLTVVGITRSARIVRARWRSVLTIAGMLLVVIGVMLPSGWAFIAGPLVLLPALLVEAGRSHCQAADQMTVAHWHG